MRESLYSESLSWESLLWESLLLENMLLENLLVESLLPIAVASETFTFVEIKPFLTINPEIMCNEALCHENLKHSYHDNIT